MSLGRRPRSRRGRLSGGRPEPVRRMGGTWHAGGRRRGDNEPPAPGNQRRPRADAVRARRQLRDPGRAAVRSNGVPRSAWARAASARCRAGTARTPRSCCCSTSAPRRWPATWPSPMFEQASAGFQDRPELFHLVAYVLLPLGWLVVALGQRRLRPALPGPGHRRVQAGRPRRRSRSRRASRSSPSPPSTDLSRLHGRHRAARRAVLHPARPLPRPAGAAHGPPPRPGTAAHRMLLVGTLPEALEVYTAVTRSPAAGLVPVAIHLTDGYAAAPGHRDPGPGVRRPRRPGPGPRGRRRHDRGLRLGQRRARRAAPAGLAARGHRHRPGRRAAADRHRRPAGAHPPDRGPAAAARRGADPVRPGAGWPRTCWTGSPPALGLLVLLPAVRWSIAIAIRLSDRGPVFFRQPRVGHEGRTFRVWKFRTMYVDAEDRLAALVDQNETDGMLFKIKDDPRIFPVGRFLRASSLDELPQLINVLKGEMSLVGPRPLPADDGDFLGDVRRRLLVRPGHHRAVAGLRPLRPVLGRGGPARPLLRGQLVAGVRPEHPVAHDRRRARAARARTRAPLARALARARGRVGGQDRVRGWPTSSRCSPCVRAGRRAGRAPSSRSLRLRARRGIATATQRATYDVLHTAGLAAEPLRTGLSTTQRRQGRTPSARAGRRRRAGARRRRTRCSPSTGAAATTPTSCVAAASGPSPTAGPPCCGTGELRLRPGGLPGPRRGRRPAAPGRAAQAAGRARGGRRRPARARAWCRPPWRRPAGPAPSWRSPSWTRPASGWPAPRSARCAPRSARTSSTTR